METNVSGPNLTSRQRSCWSLLVIFLASFIASPTFAATASVQTEVAQSEEIIERIRITGTVRSPQTSNISSAVAGLVESYEVEAGKQVTRGDVMLQLDDEQETLNLSRIRAEQAQVEAELEDARRRLAEARRLGKQADIAETEIASRQAEVKRLEAALQAAEAQVAFQQSVVRRHKVIAPFDGVVTNRLVEQGEWINPGDTLVELVSTNPLWFDFQVSQTVYPKLSGDSKLAISVDAIPNDILEGRIESIVPRKSAAARTFLLRAVASQSHEKAITPCMSVRADLYLETGRLGVTVSRDAVLRYPDGRATVWTVADATEGTIAQEQLVVTGLEFDGRVEILEGLLAGVTVVRRGNEALQPGQPLTVM